MKRNLKRKIQIAESLPAGIEPDVGALNTFGRPANKPRKFTDPLPAKVLKKVQGARNSDEAYEGIGR